MKERLVSPRTALARGSVVLFGAARAGILKAASCAGLLLLLLWPAIYNGQPLFSVDTTAYIRGFDAGVVWLSDRTSVWTTWASRPAAAQSAPETSTVGAATSFQSPSFVIAGRSVSYGTLLYIGELLGGLWASIAIQAAAALAAIGLTLRHLKLFNWPRFVATAITLGLGSSLPFFASFLLPDVFAGLALLAAANLLALADRLRRWEWVFWVCILTAAVVFHPTHLAIVLVLLAVAIVAWLFRAKISRAGILALAFAAGAGFASDTGFDLIVEKLRGVEVSRPPVVMARIIADGPGAAYLREKCPQAGFVACQFVDRLVSNSDAFLWDTSPTTGIYAPASPEQRRKLADEQYRFALAVLAYDPIGQITASFKDALDQLKMVGLSDFLPTAEQALPKLPRIYAERMEQSRIWRDDFPFASLSALTILTAMLSLIFVGVTLIRDWRIVSTEQKLFGGVILMGLLSNALICGALSGPHERYQARLTWLAPLLAVLLYYARRVTKSQTAAHWLPVIPLRTPIAISYEAPPRSGRGQQMDSGDSARAG